jgi:hypothetical protein
MCWKKEGMSSPEAFLGGGPLPPREPIIFSMGCRPEEPGKNGNGVILEAYRGNTLDAADRGRNRYDP